MNFLVGDAEAGARLDLALAALAECSRSQARRWIDLGRVRVNTRPGQASQRVRAGDVVEAIPPDPQPSAQGAEAIPLAVLFEDEDLIVLDKAPGLVVHPAPGHAGGTLVNALLHHCDDLAGVGDVLRPGIVHRLDRGTSGVLVVAKNDTAHRALSLQFKEHSVERVYTALVRGLPGPESGRVDLPIGRHPHDRKRMSVRTHSGRAATSEWRVARRYAHSERSLLEVRPRTGRTHQIRVHLAAVGLPIVGDPVYGRRGRTPIESALARPALHAARLGFTHPRSGERLAFAAPLPPDLAALIDALERREQGQRVLTHALLERVGVEHGFGVRGAPEPHGLLRPRQVHGCAVVAADACRATPAPEADAVLSGEPGVPVGVVTADCVPILCASARGELVLAVHAGWRGLARGVVAAAVDAARRHRNGVELVAVIGPHIGACCYEVDTPVLDALRHQLGDDAVKRASTGTRPGHARIDLAALCATALERGGVASASIGVLPASCTRCDATRFHSYRRDGAGAGRLVHYVTARLDRDSTHG